MEIARGTSLPALPPAKVVRPPTRLYNGVPFIVPTLHPLEEGTELSGSDISKRKGAEAKRAAHTHQPSTRAQAAKNGGKTLTPIIEYVPDPADPYTPRIAWPKSSGKQAGREFHSAKPRRPTLLARLDQTLDALGVKRVPVATTSDDIALSDDESSITGKDEAAGKPRNRRLLPPGAYQCGECQLRCEDHKAFLEHYMSRHKELLLRPADMEPDNGTS